MFGSTGNFENKLCKNIHFSYQSMKNKVIQSKVKRLNIVHERFAETKKLSFLKFLY